MFHGIEIKIKGTKKEIIVFVCTLQLHGNQ